MEVKKNSDAKLTAREYQYFTKEYLWFFNMMLDYMRSEPAYTGPVFVQMTRGKLIGVYDMRHRGGGAYTDFFSLHKWLVSELLKLHKRRRTTGIKIDFVNGTPSGIRYEEEKKAVDLRGSTVREYKKLNHDK